MFFLLRLKTLGVLHSKGNALAEYILPVALILMVTIPLWQAVASGIGEKTATVFSNNALPAGANGLRTNTSGRLSIYGRNSQPEEKGIGNINASFSNRPFTQSNTVSTIAETTGVNGDVQKIIDSANALSQLLEIKTIGTNKLSPELANIISRLANKGHMIAASIISEDTQLKQLQMEFQTIFNELSDYRLSNLSTYPQSIDSVVNDNYMTIDNNANYYAEENKDIRSLMKTSSASTSTGSSSVSKSSNTICNQGGKDCNK